jgi:hypothetical protein
MNRPRPRSARSTIRRTTTPAKSAAETLVFRAMHSPKIYRGFEVADTCTLYALAETIIAVFDFDFDHAFGFYSNLKGNIFASPVRYVLFADIGEGEPGDLGVEKTRAADAFPSPGSKMSFLFDYGDEWVFLIELVARKPRAPKTRLPRLLISAGKAPEQYSYDDEEE